MTLASFKSRPLANRAIAGSLAVHLFAVILANRFPNLILTTTAVYSTLALYLVAGPLLWLWHRATLPLDKRASLDSIVEKTEQAEELARYNPLEFFDPDTRLFAGLNIDDNLTPVYAPWSDIRSTHIQVVGPTGFGKGVATTMILAQCAAAGECVVIFDPKFPGDEFASRVLNRFAAERNIPFYLLNLSPRVPLEWETGIKVTPPQINPFRGCSYSELNELLSSGFSLEDTGKSDSHFRLHDRVACEDVCERACAANPEQVNIQDLLTAANKSKLTVDEKGKDLDLKVKIKALAKLPAIQTAAGLDLPAILDQNAILYIVGSLRDPQTIALQKMLLLRLIQIIEQRNRNLKNRPVAMMLDELKYILSAGVLQGLGAARDKGCHMMLAHQTIGDLEDCGGLPPVAVVGAVLKNTTKKLIYNVTGKDAEWAADLSGTILVQQKSSHMQQGLFHAAEGQFREVERPLITLNDLKSMPKMTGMLYGFGLAKRVQVSPMPVGDWPELKPALPLPKPQKQSEKAAIAPAAALSDTDKNNIGEKENPSQPPATDASAASVAPENASPVPAPHELLNSEHHD